MKYLPRLEQICSSSSSSNINFSLISVVKYLYFWHQSGREVSLYTSDTGVGPLSPLDNPGSSPSRLSVIK